MISAGWLRTFVISPARRNHKSFFSVSSVPQAESSKRARENILPNQKTDVRSPTSDVRYLRTNLKRRIIPTFTVFDKLC